MTRIRAARRVPPVLMALGCSLAIAACGTSGSSAATTASGASNAGLKFAQCMRSHGVSNFPDPGSHGGGFQVQLAGGTNPSSPAFQAAQQACQKILGPSPPRTPPTAAENAAAFQFQGAERFGKGRCGLTWVLVTGFGDRLHDTASLRSRIGRRHAPLRVPGCGRRARTRRSARGRDRVLWWPHPTTSRCSAPPRRR